MQSFIFAIVPYSTILYETPETRNELNRKWKWFHKILIHTKCLAKSLYVSATLLRIEGIYNVPYMTELWYMFLFLQMNNIIKSQLLIPKTPYNNQLCQKKFFTYDSNSSRVHYVLQSLVSVFTCIGYLQYSFIKEMNVEMYSL
jgi:hypothetical protein